MKKTEIINDPASDGGEDTKKNSICDSPSYLNKLTRTRLLTLEEEHEMACRAKKGDQNARNRLIEANMRLVVNIARHYHNALVPFEDLIQEGAIGLMMAVQRFDTSRGTRFSTYATHWIRQAINRALDNKSKSIRVPAHISDSLRRLERARAELIRETGEEPNHEALSQKLGMTPRKVALLIQASQEPVSLDMLVGDEENTTLLSLLNNEEALNPQDLILSEEKNRQLASLFLILTPREAEVMRCRLGFEMGNGSVLQEIGEKMHISRERVRQIEIIALKKMRLAAKLRDLADYLVT